MPKLISESGVEYGAVVEAGFTRKTSVKQLDPDHPVVKAYEKSWEDQSTLEIPTSDPVTTAKLLRKHARLTGRAVRVQQKDTSVVFRAREFQPRTPK